MDLFTRDELRTLLAKRNGPCVSVYIPTNRGQSLADKTRWKNQMREAEERLKEAGVRSSEARDLLAAGNALLDDIPFWKNVPIGGLAGFLAPGFSRFYRVPLTLPDRAVAGDHFHVKPLLPLFTANGRFFLLALSREKVRFLHGTRQTVDRVELVNVPESQDEALYNTDEGETRSTINHPSPDPRAHRKEEIFRGPGTNTESNKDGLREYCEKLNHSLHKYLADERAPLVLATVEELASIYRMANSYRFLLDQFVEGNPELLSDKELHDKAWPIAEAYFRQEEEKMMALYQQLDATGTGLTAHHLPQVVQAAYNGQIQYLFVPVGQERWGRFNPDDQSVELHETMQAGDEDLLNLAASFVLQHKGTVYALTPEQVPGMQNPAAIFWLPLSDKQDGRVIAEATTKV